MLLSQWGHKAEEQFRNRLTKQQEFLRISLPQRFALPSPRCAIRGNWGWVGLEPKVGNAGPGRGMEYRHSSKYTLNLSVALKGTSVIDRPPVHECCHTKVCWCPRAAVLPLRTTRTNRKES